MVSAAASPLSSRVRDESPEGRRPERGFGLPTARLRRRDAPPSTTLLLRWCRRASVQRLRPTRPLDRIRPNDAGSPTQDSDAAIGVRPAAARHDPDQRHRAEHRVQRRRIGTYEFAPSGSKGGPVPNFRSEGRDFTVFYLGALLASPTARCISRLMRRLRDMSARPPLHRCSDNLTSPTEGYLALVLWRHRGYSALPR